MSDAPGEDPIISELSANGDLIDIIEEFVAELPERVSAITAALESQNFDHLQQLVHQLKGAAGGYGFSKITDSAEALEKVMHELDGAAPTSAIRRELESLTELCRRARAR